jgi:hypothetical protein
MRKSLGAYRAQTARGEAKLPPFFRLGRREWRVPGSLTIGKPGKGDSDEDIVVPIKADAPVLKPDERGAGETGAIALPCRLRQGATHHARRKLLQNLTQSPNAQGWLLCANSGPSAPTN